MRTKEDYFYFEKKLAGVQSLADKTKTLENVKHTLNYQERRGDFLRN